MNKETLAQYHGKTVDISWPDGQGATAFIVGHFFQHRFEGGAESVGFGLLSDEGYEFLELATATVTVVPDDQLHSGDLLREAFSDATKYGDPNVKAEVVRSMVGRTVSRVSSQNGGKPTSFVVTGYVEEHWADPEDWSREVVTFWLSDGKTRRLMLLGDVYSIGS